MHEPFKLVSILWNWIEIIPTYPKQNIVQTKEKKLGITIEHQIKKTPPLLRMRLALLRHRLFGILSLSLRGSVEKITTLSRHSLSAQNENSRFQGELFPGIWHLKHGTDARVKNAAENPVNQCADAPPPWLAVGKPIVFGVALQQVMLLRITQCWFTNHFQISNSITANPCISMRKSQTWSLLIGEHQCSICCRMFTWKKHGFSN